MAGPFSKYRNLYKEPERLTPDEARQRRLLTEIDRQRKVLEDQATRLSQASQSNYHREALKRFEVRTLGELEASRAEERRLSSIRRRTADQEARLREAKSVRLQHEQRRDALRMRADAERRANLVKASAADRRQFHPAGSGANPRTIFGTEALVGVRFNSRAYFKKALLSVPCVQRVTRREVMFARGHGGRGHRVPHRFNPLSFIDC